jgi:6-phosphofructokinase 2
MDILTVTLNPALDLSTAVERVTPEDKLQCNEPQRDPGGGGINVARVVHELGGAALGLWTRGGHVGELFEDRLDAMGVPHRAIPIAAETRENMTVYEEVSGLQYRFGMPGPRISGDELDAMLKAVTSHKDCPYVVLSGSLPAGAPDDAYQRFVDACSDKTRVVLDTRGAPLRAALETGVYLVKPNLRELGALAGRKLESDEAIEEAARRLVQRGAAKVVVTSLGAGGVIVATGDGCARVRAPTVPIRSKVGAGDSTVGGLVHALARGWDVDRATRFGVAAGAAAVMTPGTELCRRADVERVFDGMG